MKRWIFVFVLLCGAVRAVPVDDGMYATLQTTMGEVCFELYYTNVPQTVANFVSLAEGTRPWIDPRDGFVKSGPFYDGIVFHRVVSNRFVQCGSPNGDGTDGPGYTFEDEFDSALRHDAAGVVSMANSGVDSNGSQFFITAADTSWLDDVHSVFGRVVEGLDTVFGIAAVDVGANDRPLTDVTITNVFITRNGVEAQGFSVTNQGLPEVSALPLSIASDSGLSVSAGTATSSYQYVYSSTNLSDWRVKDFGYWPESDGDWTLQITPGSCEYFRANRVVYPSDQNRTGNPVDHELVMTIGSDVFTVVPTGVDSGNIQVNSGTNSVVTSWSWGAGPHVVAFDIRSENYLRFGFNLKYVSATNGFCDGYYDFYPYGWQYIGAGTFTDTVP